MTPLEKCKKAMEKLASFLEETDPSEAEQAGVIQAFEYNHELFWKIFQKIAAQEGINVASPRQAFKAAFQLGLITNEQAWLELMNDRNSTSHTYNEDLAFDIYQRIRDSHFKQFQEALTKLEVRIGNENIQ